MEVIEFFSPLHGGGPIEIEYKLLKALKQRGHEIMIYISDFELDIEYIESLDGVKVYPFRSICLGRLGFRLYFAPEITCKLKREVKEFDIVHMQNYITFKNVVPCYYAHKYNLPCILQVHSGIDENWAKMGHKDI